MGRPSIENTQRESAWRRGWSDTKAAVTSWWFLLFDIIVGLLTALVIGNWQGTIWGAGAGAGALLGFALLVLGWNLHRAPIRQRNECWAREEQREQLRPEIGTEIEVRDIHSEEQKCHLLKVTNSSWESISDYYARFLEFRDPYSRAIGDLMEYELCWYKAGHDLREKEIDIPPETYRYLHLFTTVDGGDEMGIPQVVDGNYSPWNMILNPVSSDEYYTAILEIGSLSGNVSVPSVKVKLKITYRGGHSLSVEIKAGPVDIGPPEPGSDPSYTQRKWFVV